MGESRRRWRFSRRRKRLVGERKNLLQSSAPHFCNRVRRKFCCRDVRRAFLPSDSEKFFRQRQQACRLFSASVTNSNEDSNRIHRVYRITFFRNQRTKSRLKVFAEKKFILATLSILFYSPIIVLQFRFSQPPSATDFG